MHTPKPSKDNLADGVPCTGLSLRGPASSFATVVTGGAGVRGLLVARLFATPPEGFAGSHRQRWLAPALHSDRRTTTRAHAFGRTPQKRVSSRTAEWRRRMEGRIKVTASASSSRRSSFLYAGAQEQRVYRRRLLSRGPSAVDHDRSAGRRRLTSCLSLAARSLLSERPRAR